MTPATDPSAPRSRPSLAPGVPVGPDLAIAIAAGIGEALLAAAFVMAVLPPAVIGIGHVAIVAILYWHAFERAGRGYDATRAALLALATAAAGPIGALISAAALPFFPAGPRTHVLQAWYDRIALAAETDSESQLSDRIVTGRVSPSAGASPERFTDVITRGDLGRQQAVLGIIARKFHPDYAPALAAALKSPEPVLRVQAAAVAIHISQRLDTGIEQLMHWSRTTHPVRLESAGIVRERDLLAAGAFSDFRRARLSRRLAALGLFRLRTRSAPSDTGQSA